MGSIALLVEVAVQRADGLSDEAAETAAIEIVEGALRNDARILDAQVGMTAIKG